MLTQTNWSHLIFGGTLHLVTRIETAAETRWPIRGFSDSRCLSSHWTVQLISLSSSFSLSSTVLISIITCCCLNSIVCLGRITNKCPTHFRWQWLGISIQDSRRKNSHPLLILCLSFSSPSPNPASNNNIQVYAENRKQKINMLICQKCQFIANIDAKVDGTNKMAPFFDFLIFNLIKSKPYFSRLA